MISLKPKESESVATFAGASAGGKPLTEKFLKIFSKNPKVPQSPAVTVFRSPVKGLLFGSLDGAKNIKIFCVEP